MVSKAQGLLCTRHTMEQDFYRLRIQERFGVEVVVPDHEGKEIVNRIIYDELCLGNINDVSRQAYRGIIQQLEQQGAEGIILGCTEIPLLIGDQDAIVPLFDTSKLHAIAAAKFALNQSSI